MMAPVFSLGQLAEQLGASLRGASDIPVRGLASLQEAEADQLSFLANPQYRKHLPACKAAAVLLTEADAMNGAAANSLLKILEEPPSSVYFILVSSRSRFLLPTVRSRCRALGFSPPDPDTARRILSDSGCGTQSARYLGLAGGAPFRVAQWMKDEMLGPLDSVIESLISPPGDPMALANRWDGILKSETGFKLDQLVEAVQRWVFDLTQDALAGRIHYHTDWKKQTKVPGGHSAEALIGAWQQLIQFRRSSRHPLNQLLFLESLATEFLRATRPVRQ